MRVLKNGILAVDLLHLPTLYLRGDYRILAAFLVAVHYEEGGEQIVSGVCWRSEGRLRVSCDRWLPFGVYQRVREEIVSQIRRGEPFSRWQGRRWQP